MGRTGDPKMATPKRVRTYRPKHSDASLSHGWRINMANKKKALETPKAEFGVRFRELPVYAKEIRRF